MLKHKKIILLAVAGLLIGLAWWYLRYHASGRMVTGIAQDPASTLQNVDGRTNVVFLGVGGEEHAGGDLTDSIIVFSYDHANYSVTLIPIPRDIWVPSLQAKINTAYHYGNERREGGGRDLMKSSVSEVIGQPIAYVVVLDFHGFETMIDTVGGIDVDVAQSFDDYLYPIAGKEDAEPESERYEHLHFDKGMTHMNGETALKFARSRHAEGDEGTDFARSKRQEKVIIAFKDKLLSSKTLLNITTLQNLVTSVSDSLDTDIKDKEAGAFIRLFLTYAQSGATPRSISIEDLYFTPKNKSPYQGQWVLVPNTTIEDIHAYVAKALAGE